MAYIYSSFSHKGHRKKNEDCILIRSAKIGSDDICMGIVCDGVGGLRKGEVASNSAVEFMSDWFERIALKSSCDIEYDYIKKSMIKNTHKANMMIAQYGERNNLRCATTLCAFILFNEKFFAINVGDSRIYICANGLHQLSTDDSAGNGVLTQCVGLGDEITVNTDEGLLRDGEALFICTDGFYADMDSNAVQNMLENATYDNCVAAVEDIVCKKAQVCADDNITAGFVRYIENVDTKNATARFFKSLLPNKNNK